MLKIRLSSLVALPLAFGLAACSSGSSDTDMTPDPQVAAAPARADAAIAVDTTSVANPARDSMAMANRPADTAAVGVPAGGVTQTPTDTAAAAARDTAANAAGYQASGAAGMTHNLTLPAVNNSGFTGNAVLTDLSGGKTKVALTLSAPANAVKSVDHDAHFHSGTCAAPGPVVYELKDVRADGEVSETEIAASMTTLMDGSFVVQAHEDNGATPIVCAEVKKAM